MACPFKTAVYAATAVCAVSRGSDDLRIKTLGNIACATAIIGGVVYTARSTYKYFNPLPIEEQPINNQEVVGEIPADTCGS